MNILLLYPEIPETFWSYRYALKFIQKRAFSPPLGLLTLAPLLPDSWNKTLVDLNVEKLRRSHLEWADYAFISGMTLQREAAHSLISRCKEAGVKVVGGGPLFSSDPDNFPDADHLVLDEAEITLPHFLRDLQNGNNPEHIYRSEEHPELTTSPVPAYELVRMDQYATMPVQYSRGCPYNCEFCNVTALFGHRPRTKSSDQVIAELDKLSSLGWKGNVFFVDDNFIGHRKNLKNDLLPAIIDWRSSHQDIHFHTEVSINIADDQELMDMLVSAGLHTVFIGIETPEDAGLAEAGKSQNQNRDMVADVQRLHQAGIQVQGGFIVGFDSDTPRIFQQVKDFIQESRIVVAMVGLLQAPAGTTLYKRLKESGRLLGEMSGDNVDGTTNILPMMGLDTLRNGYQSLIKSLYTPAEFYQRVRLFLQDYSGEESRRSLSWQSILALFRSVYYLGIRGKERLHYWKLIFWTLRKRPRLFPMAVTMSIYGYHFRQISELHIL